MIDAYVYPDSNGIHVTLILGDTEIDDAGPFDDVVDAIEMAERSVFDGGSVSVSESIRAWEEALPAYICVSIGACA